MSEVRIQYCDLCSKAIAKGFGYNLKPMKRVNAFMLKMSGAVGGWGHGSDIRVMSKGNFDPNHDANSLEVCNECFAEFVAIAEKVQAWLDGRKDINWEEPHVPDIERRESDSVSGVRNDEPQQERRGAKVLRMLQPVSRLLGFRKKRLA